MNPSNPANPNPPFFGQRISAQGVNVNSATKNQLLYQNNYDESLQTYYGTNGQIALQIGQLATSQFGMSVPTANGTLNFGQLADGGLGMNTVNTSGQLLFEMNGQTWYWYDTSGNIVMMVGFLPVTGVYGWAVATPGNSLAGQV
jgi:hypothetical protein